MRITVAIAVVSVILVLFAAIPISLCDEGILIAHGDHIELTCEDDGSLSVAHTILETANVTKNVSSVATYSIEGTLNGNVTFENNPEIREPIISSETKDGITNIFINFSATLAPLKFTKFKLFYSLKGLLKNENGTWHLKVSFNTEAAAPPEIVVKIPKPSTFRKLVVKNTVPSPNVFTEESNYYSLVYKEPLFEFGNIGTTSIDISYDIVWDSDAIFWWGILSIATIAIGAILGYFGKRVILAFNRHKQSPTFEMHRDKEGKFRFRLKAANGEIIAVSQGYGTKRACKEGIESAKLNSPNAQTKDNT